MLAFVLLAALAAGCGRFGFGPSGPGSGSTGDATGSGSPQDGAGDGADAQGDGQMTGSGVCGSTVALFDDFEDGVTAPEWTTLTANNIALAETGGFLQMTFASNTPSGQVAGYKQTATMDYTGACTILEIAQIPNPATTANGLIRIGIGPTDCALFELLQGNLDAVWHNGANVSSTYMGAWKSVAHRFVRIREQSGTWFWDVSPDGVTFTQVGMATQTIVGQTAAYLQLSAGTNSGVSNGGQLQFASVRVLVRP